ncbi:MAG: transposase [Phycisphaeraceae bacterium]|nr:transposase [Phycisphaeraceae bacterium]
MPIYLITWTTYGTWLHGDDRESVSAKQTTAGTPKVAPNGALRRHQQATMREPAFTLDEAQRLAVDEVVRFHCTHRGWTLHAINVRTNHVHGVVSAPTPPERVMGEFKAWATRRLRERGTARERLWSRHASTRWIDTDASLHRAIEYVTNEQ